MIPYRRNIDEVYATVMKELSRSGKKVIIEGQRFEVTPFSKTEVATFYKDFDTVIAPIVYREGKYTPLTLSAALLQMRHKHILYAGMVAKKQMGDITFAGLKAGNEELGFRQIKPDDILRTTDTTETPASSWNFDFAAGQDYWIGYGTDNTTPVNIDRNALLAAVGLINESTTRVVEQLQFKIGETDYKPEVLYPTLSLVDTPERIPVMPIGTRVFLPRQQVLAKVYSSDAATNKLAILGITYGRGSFLAEFVRTRVDL